MKKKLPLIGLILTVLLTVWSVVSIVLLRGAGAYRVGTKLGNILAASRPYTLAAAILLIAALLTWLAIRKSRKASVIPAAPAQPDNAATSFPKPKKQEKNKKQKAGSKKIAPAATEAKIAPKPPMEDNETVLVRHTEDMTGAADTQTIQPATPEMGSTTVLISPAAPESESSTVLIAPAAPIEEEATILLSVEETHIEPEDHGTLPVPEEGAPQIQTMPPTEKPVDDSDTQLLPTGDSVTPCCPECGTPIVKDGQRFCAKCGTELKGGGK